MYAELRTLAPMGYPFSSQPSDVAEKRTDHPDRENGDHDKERPDTDLVEDPDENHNLAETYPDVVALLRGRMEAWLGKREQETGLPNPIHHQGDWHGHEGVGSFVTSQQAYDTLHIGDVQAARRLQAKSREAKKG